MLAFDSPDNSSATVASTVSSVLTSSTKRPSVVLTKPGRAKSAWWEHFDKFDEKVHPDKKGWAKCVHCQELVKYVTSTDKLERHVHKVHKDLAQELQAKKAKLDMEQQSVKSWAKPKSSVMQAFMKWTIMTYQPLNTCEDPYFRNLCRSLNKDAEVFGRGRITAKVQEAAARMRHLLSDTLCGKVIALTTDHWTSIANQSYLAITAHWIDEDWALQYSTLCCTHHPLTRETAPEVARVVQEGWEAFGIGAQQIVAVVTDTAPNMNAAGQIFPCPHHYCVAHVLELTTGLAFTDVHLPGAEGTMKAVRHLIGHFNSSNQQLEMLLNLQVGVKKVGVIEDVATRWWSTYNSCERLLRLKPYFALMVANHGLTCDLTELQWKVVESITKLLRPFMEVQKLLEAQKYVTISLIPYCINKIRSGLSEFIAQCDLAPVRHLGTALQNNFVLHWGTGAAGTVFDENAERGQRRRQKGMQKSVLVAAALDPRTKGLVGIPAGDQLLLWDHVAALMHTVDANVDGGDAEGAHNAIPDIDPNDFFADLGVAPVQAVAQQGADPLANELAAYRAAQPLRIKVGDNYTNPLEWWLQHEERYPTLAHLARRFLCIPATSAPSERVFSQAGLTIANARARMLPDLADDLVFLHGAMHAVPDEYAIFD
jgi:hypothetical protein